MAVVGIRNHQHITGMNRLPAADTGAIKAKSVFKGRFIQFAHGHRKMLPHSREIHELEINHFGALLFCIAQNFLRGHAHSSLCSSKVFSELSTHISKSLAKCRHVLHRTPSDSNCRATGVTKPKRPVLSAFPHKGQARLPGHFDPSEIPLLCISKDRRALSKPASAMPCGKIGLPVANAHIRTFRQFLRLQPTGSRCWMMLSLTESTFRGPLFGVAQKCRIA